MLWDQYKTANDDRWGPDAGEAYDDWGHGSDQTRPGPGGWWYHHAPTTERDRIQQHGLIPAKPGLNPQWGFKPDEEIPDWQPEGVYFTNSPDNQLRGNWRSPMDTWRVPATQVSVQKDPLQNPSVYTTEPVQNPELFRPFEKSNQFDQWQNPGASAWRKDLYDDRLPSLDEMAQPDFKMPRDIMRDWGIGEPTETWRRATSWHRIAGTPAVVPGKGGILLKELGVPGWEKYMDRSAFLYYPQSNAVILGQPGQHHSDLLGEYERLSDKFEPYYGQVWHREGETPSFEHFVGEDEWDPSPVYQALQRKWPNLQQTEGEYHGTYSSRRKSATSPKPWEAKMWHGKPSSRGLMGPVRCPFWSTSAQEEAHGMAGDGGSVHPVSVRFHNPAHFFANANWGPESLELARQSGHDGAVVHWPGQIDDPANPQPPRKWAIALDPGTVVPGHLQDSYDSGV